MSKRRKLKMFKNDPFGIKYEIFCIRLNYCLKKEIGLRIQALALYLNAINTIGIPRDDEEKILLKEAVRKYDETVNELEEHLRYARMYVEDESK